MKTESSFLSIRDVGKSFGSLTALDGVSLEIPRGEFFGLLGPNGAGKSTLMSLIVGLKTPGCGTIALDGEPLSAKNRGQLGFVPQGIALYPRLNARENLSIFGGLQGLGGRELASRIDELLAAVQLSDRASEPVSHFSGGMQRRLNLASALLHRPKLLLCDEPTVGVDPQSRNAIFELLEHLNAEGLTVIYSTHYLEEATRLCSRIGIIDHGKILTLGTLDELLGQLAFHEQVRFPRNELTRELARALARRGEVREEESEICFRPAADFALSEFYREAEVHRVPNRLIQHERPTLEALFLQLTGRALRE
jgi:ABC-2 type transport system ATP-binding protein